MSDDSHRLKVMFDLSIVPHALGGVSRYLTSLWKALASTAPDHDIEILPVDVPAAHPGVPGALSKSVRLDDPFYLRIPYLRRAPIRLGWEQRSRPMRLSALQTGCDLYHHSGVQPFHPPGSLSVLTMYDLTAIEHPDWHTAETVCFAEREKAMLLSGSAAAAISGWTAERAVELLQLDPLVVRPIGGAADDLFTPGDPEPDIMAKHILAPGGYLLHVGNFVPRKNIPFLLKAYSAARKQSGFDLPLVLVGAGGWGGIDPQSSEGVTVLRGIDDSDLLQLYRGARALMFPSQCEGLGLPALEALACGTPVIASCAAALPETIGGNGVLIEPGDEDAWVGEMTGISGDGRYAELKDLALKASYRRRTWTDVAAALCQFYRDLASE